MPPLHRWGGRRGGVAKGSRRCGMGITLAQFWSLALAGCGGNANYFNIPMPDRLLISWVENLFGIDASDFTFCIGESEVRHIFNRHGDPEQERRRGNIYVSVVDLELIPRILSTFTDVRLGDRPQRLVITKQTDNLYFLVLEVSKKQRRIRLVTLYKKPIPV